MKIPKFYLSAADDAIRAGWRFHITFKLMKRLHRIVIPTRTGIARALKAHVALQQRELFH